MKCKTKLIVPIILAAATFLFTGCDSDEYDNGYDIALLPPSSSEAEAALDSTFDPRKIKADRWMCALKDYRKLKYVIMPGSHDSGMAKPNMCTVGASPFAQTQSLIIRDQLRDGTRFFDIRIDVKNGKLYTYHMNAKGQGCYGELFEGNGETSIMYKVKEFLERNSSEFVILKFTDFYGTSARKDQTKRHLYDYFINNWSHDDIVFKKDVETNYNLVNNISVKDVRGKAVCVFANFPNYYYDPSKGVFYLNNNAYAWACNFSVYNSFGFPEEGTTNYEKMKKTRLGRLERNGGYDKDYIFLLAWTLTPGIYSVKHYADQINPRMPRVLLYDIWKKHPHIFPQIVDYDYVSKSLNQYIIQYNDDVRGYDWDN